MRTNNPNSRWQIIISREAERVLRRLPRNMAQRIRQAIDRLATSPRPPGCKKLVGYDNLYRIRVGEWRIIYALEDDKLVILIMEIAPRGRAYRNL
ncbi:type II toxin-antitoxin system RelE/ParE family toxin [Candidatus Poribacteria bacterium]|nr:type II toxin-antitoxin system RelE/ParE family toxin [Candidatus Poribacteria bacterium]